MTGRKAVFLDRDGVLVESDVRSGRPHPVASVEAVRLVQGAGEACARLADAGLTLVVVTNQPDVARGVTPLAVVEAINAEVARRLPVDDVKTCLHDDADECRCRKPLPGLLVDAAHEHGLDLRASVMVGDRGKDIAAGRAAGCGTVLVDGGHDEPVSPSPDVRFPSLLDAVEWILGYEPPDGPSNDSRSASPAGEPTS